MNPLLAHGGQVTTKATKDGGSLRSTKTARDLLLHLHHPNILFRQIIIERHNELMHKPQDQRMILSQAMQQVAHLISPQRTSCAFFSLRWGIGCDPLLNQLQIALFVLLPQSPRHHRFALRASQVNLRFDLQEQLLHLLRPFLLLMLMAESEFPQMMASAEAMQTGVWQ